MYHRENSESIALDSAYVVYIIRMFCTLLYAFTHGKNTENKYRVSVEGQKKNKWKDVFSIGINNAGFF